jgi:hypothetical protein
MDKTLKIYILFLVFLIIGIAVLDANAPKPINWTPTYSIKDKIPFGLYVFDQESKSLFKNQEIEKVNVTAYEYLLNKYDEDTLVDTNSKKETFISIAEYPEIDNESVDELCYFVSQGNCAFLSAKNLPSRLLDSLKLSVDGDFKYTDTIFNWLANKKLNKKKYKIIEGIGNNHFSKIDTLNTTVLGYQSGDSTRVNYIKVKYFDGEFLLHTQPAAFSNFHLLKSDHYQYAASLLSYIPKNKIFWLVKNQNGEVISQSPMRFILSQPALRWAWWLFLLGVLIFMIFNAKRKQRIIAIKKPLPNTTVDFIKTIGNLYYQEGDHDNIIDKKIIYFLEKIRTEYLIDTTILDEDFIKKLEQKSGKNKIDIQKTIFLINTHKRSPNNSIEEDLIAINNAIEKIIT